MQALQRFHESNVLAAKISEVFRPKVSSNVKRDSHAFGFFYATFHMRCLPEVHAGARVCHNEHAKECNITLLIPWTGLK